MNDERDLDKLLDAALASYGDEEPDPSLRARIYARVAEPMQRSWPMWLFGAGGACAVAILFAVFLVPRAPSPLSQPSTAPSIARASEPSAPVTAAARQMAHPHALRAVHRTRWGQQPTVERSAYFPSPTPLTAEESTLLKFATEHPDQARRALAPAAMGPVESEPVTIAPIRIAALSESQETPYRQ